MVEKRPATPGFIEPEGEIVVMMSPGHVRAYQEWLHAKGLYLFQIPASPDDDPYYAVGVSDGLYNALAPPPRG